MADMSAEAKKFFGLNEADNTRLLTKKKGKMQLAWKLNDLNKWSFNRIANAIERTFEL